MGITKNVLDLIGRTPLVYLEKTSESLGVDFLAKLEGHNLTGSVKDRAARYMIQGGIERGLIGPDTLVIESTSGNFGVALARVCRSLGIRCLCVTDLNANQLNRFLIEQAGAGLEVVDEPDDSGGYLKSRLRRVQELLGEHPNAFWVNQYANDDNWRAHYHGTAREIAEQVAGRVDYFFACVSSGGTLMGCARYLHEVDPGIRVVAVDIKGSVIFGGESSPRHIPGAGASRTPEILDRKEVDELIHVSEEETVMECRRLLREEGLFVGGSSGSVSRGVQRFFQGSRRTSSRPVVVAIFPDRGERYFQTVFDDGWANSRYPGLISEADQWMEDVAS